MIKKFLVLASLLIAQTSHSNHVAISFGPSMNGGVNPKYAALGYEFVFPQMSYLSECGAMFAQEFSYICAGVLSVRTVTASGLFTRIGAGPSWVSKVDDRLSSRFNFSLQGMVGLTHDGWATGVKYQHYSNAGIVPPNMGRDFVLAVVEIGI